MDVNETIIRAWLESKGFLVRSRLRYDLSPSGDWSSASDIDLIGHNPKTGQNVAVLITAWMTQTIAPSQFNVGKPIRKKLENFSSPAAQAAIRKALGIRKGKKWWRWFVVSRVSPTSKAQVETLCKPYVDKVFEFREVMEDLVNYVRATELYFPHESEALQTIRALLWCKLI